MFNKLYINYLVNWLSKLNKNKNLLEKINYCLQALKC